MRVSRQQLLDALVRVEPGRAPKPRLTQSGCYIFKGGRVICYNEEVCVRAASPLPKDFTGAVPAEQLRAAVESFPDDELDLTPDGAVLKVGARRLSARVRLDRDIILPVDDVVPPKQWVQIPDPDALAAAVRHCGACCGTNNEEFLTVCVHIGPGYFEGSDRFSAGRYVVETGLDPDDPDNDFVVRAKSLMPIADYGVTWVGKTPDWLHFRSESVVYSCRRSVESYLDLSKAWDFSGSRLVLPQGAAEAAKLAAVFCGTDKAQSRVRVDLKGRHMRITGAGDMGEATAVLETGYEGEPLAFRISPTVLETVVKKHTECEVGPGILFVRGDVWDYVASLADADEPSDAQAEDAAAEAAHAGE